MIESIIDPNDETMLDFFRKRRDKWRMTLTVHTKTLASVIVTIASYNAAGTLVGPMILRRNSHMPATWFYFDSKLRVSILLMHSRFFRDPAVCHRKQCPSGSFPAGQLRADPHTDFYHVEKIESRRLHGVLDLPLGGGADRRHGDARQGARTPASTCNRPQRVQPWKHRRT